MQGSCAGAVARWPKLANVAQQLYGARPRQVLASQQRHATFACECTNVARHRLLPGRASAHAASVNKPPAALRPELEISKHGRRVTKDGDKQAFCCGMPVLLQQLVQIVASPIGCEVLKAQSEPSLASVPEPSACMSATPFYGARPVRASARARSRAPRPADRSPTSAMLAEWPAVL
mmetsp:Transcript_82159/g.241216  ORF Transcript_82159/g.241216 Transcript_82159/m.241216 type:complete len:177 (+) Transcript_82159:870-1400(+)